ncbi:hypothetical protein Dmats_46485 [Dactylosporangium matsuzakiense]|nr:hypothetical protein Dmats_46485 [Dactylosporangium matsuzakiense]
MAAHGVRAEVPDVNQYRRRWLELGVPASEIKRAAAFQRQWGGLVLPPAPDYDGGPRYFQVDTPERFPAGSTSSWPESGWCFEAGPQRTAVPYSFMIGPEGEFGISAGAWVTLHETVEGWVESVALATHAAYWAKQITKMTGEMLDQLNLDGFQPVAEVRGRADTWWRGTDSLVAIYSGESALLGVPVPRTAWVYAGLDAWELHGGV